MLPTGLCSVTQGHSSPSGPGLCQAMAVQGFPFCSAAPNFLLQSRMAAVCLSVTHVGYAEVTLKAADQRSACVLVVSAFRIRRRNGVGNLQTWRQTRLFQVDPTREAPGLSF